MSSSRSSISARGRSFRLRGIASLGVLSLVWTNTGLAEHNASGNVVSWPANDGGWYQVQETVNPWRTFCTTGSSTATIVTNGAQSLSGSSCSLPNGSYKIRNHNSSDAWEDFSIPAALNSGSIVNVVGNDASWSSTGWFQVQLADNPWTTVCESATSTQVTVVGNGVVSLSGSSCRLPDGNYKIKNYSDSSGDWVPFEVPQGNVVTPPITPPVVTPPEANSIVNVVGNDASWSSTGWFQVQLADNPWTTVCESSSTTAVNTSGAGVVSLSGSSCRLPDGNYKIRNHSDTSGDWVPFAVPQGSTETPPGTPPENTDTVLGSSLVRNRSRANFFFAEQHTPFDDIPFAHRNNSGTPYGDEQTETNPLVRGRYNTDANHPIFTTQWGDNNAFHSDASGTTRFNDTFNYTTGTNPKPADGTPGTQGDFRIECQWSHFGYDDPIVHHDAPRQANQSHLHMFWGNTSVDFSTDLNPTSENFITTKGGSTCQGGALNRSSYWMPALMHGDNMAMAPREIIVYYKARAYRNGGVGLMNHEVINTVNMPQGLQLIAGNGDREGAIEDASVNLRNLNKRHHNWGGVAEKHGDQFTTSSYIAWECGTNGRDIHKFNRIPTQAEWDLYCAGEDLNATIYFPQCRVPTDANGNNDLSNDNFRDHVRHTKVDSGCPAGTYSARMPQLGYRIYWDISELTASSTDGLSIDHLRLASDPSHDQFNWKTRTAQEILEAPPVEDRVAQSNRPALFGHPVNDPNVAPGVQRYRAANCGGDEERVPGGTLHADWVAGWKDELQELWLDNCSRDSVGCTLGQTGTNLALAGGSMDYAGHPGTLRNENNDVVGSQGSYLISVPGSGMSMCSSEMPRGMGGETTEPAAPPPPAPTSSELISDGGFEVSDFASTSWRNIRARDNVTTTIEWQSRDQSDPNNERSVLIGNRSRGWHGISQDVIVPATRDEVQIGQVATLSAYVKLATGSASSRVRLRVQVLDDRTRWTTINLGWVNVNGWSWTHVEADWPVTWEGTLKRIRYRIDGVAATEDFLVDDASFTIE